MIRAVILGCYGVIKLDQHMLAVQKPGHNPDIDLLLLDYIEQLRQDYKTAVLSNVSQGRLREVIGEQDATRCFDVLIESGALGYAKPDPEIYEYTADQLGVRIDECVFTDDRQEYCEAASAVGMHAITYKTFVQFRSELQRMLS